MTFENFKNIKCDCFEGASERPELVLARRTPKNFLREVDFETYHEKGRLPKEDDSCDEICGLRGVSLTQFHGIETQDGLQNIAQVVSLAPGYRPFAIMLKIKVDGGNIKHTPNETNPDHHDLYKSDQFNIENHVEVIKAINLIDVYNTQS